MNTTIRVIDLDVDDLDSVSAELEKGGSRFQLNIHDGTDEEKEVGMWLESTCSEAAIMFKLTKENAIFFGKSLIALAENI